MASTRSSGPICPPPPPQLLNPCVQVDKGVLYYRPLIDPLTTDQNHLLQAESLKFDGRPWENAWSELVEAWWTQDVGVSGCCNLLGCCPGKDKEAKKAKEAASLEAVFCSELVAHLYKVSSS